MQSFCNNKLTFIIIALLQMFFVRLKPVSEPPVHEHMQRKEHVSQTLPWVGLQCVIVAFSDHTQIL